MKLVIEVDDELVCEGFERNFTEEEKNILIRAIGNGTPYEERPQGEWIKIGELGLAYKCNKCGEVDVVPTNFCSNCGVYMKRKESMKAAAIVTPTDKGMCYKCQYKTDSCQEGLHCIRDSEG